MAHGRAPQRCLARSDEAVGYCQGLGFVSAFLLLYLPPGDTLSLLQALLRRYDMAKLLSRDLVQVRPALDELSEWVALLLPDVAANFTRVGVEATMYASSWLITLYSSHFPLEFVAAFMDRFLAQGWPAWFKTALALLQSRRSELAAARDLEACLGELKGLAARTDGVLGAAARINLSLVKSLNSSALSSS